MAGRRVEVVVGEEERLSAIALTATSDPRGRWQSITQARDERGRGVTYQRPLTVISRGKERMRAGEVHERGCSLCLDIRGRGIRPWDRADAGPDARVAISLSKMACEARENAFWRGKSRWEVVG